MPSPRKNRFGERLEEAYRSSFPSEKAPWSWAVSPSGRMRDPVIVKSEKPWKVKRDDWTSLKRVEGEAVLGMIRGTPVGAGASSARAPAGPSARARAMVALARN